jgi:hypothetical protein
MNKILPVTLSLCFQILWANNIGISVLAGPSIISDSYKDSDEDLGISASGEIYYQYTLSESIFIEASVKGEIEVFDLNGPDILVYNNHTYEYELSNGKVREYIARIGFPIRIGYNKEKSSFVIGAEATNLVLNARHFEIVRSGSPIDSTKSLPKSQEWMLGLSASYRYIINEKFNIRLDYELAAYLDLENKWTGSEETLYSNKLKFGVTYISDYNIRKFISN